MLLIELICLQVILVYLIDLSGAIDSFKRFLSSQLTNGVIKSTNYSLKPFSCSLCMVWWVGLFYLIYTDNFTLPLLLYVCLLSFFTTPIKDLLLNIRELLIKIVNYGN
jgi:hypothetical protein